MEAWRERVRSRAAVIGVWGVMGGRLLTLNTFDHPPTRAV